MNLPIGSVVKTKDDKIVVITGYLVTTDPYVDGGLPKTLDYSVIPYPFDCVNIEYDMKYVKDCKWYMMSSETMNQNDITEVLFTGYQDSSFASLKLELARQS